MTFIWILLFATNVFSTVFFSADTDIYSWKDIVMVMLCCFLPIIPVGYAYRWCNKFVRGEI